jgi:hypothetical protein
MPQGPNGEVNGTDILVQVESAVDSGIYITVGSQRGATFGEQTALVDMSSKENRKAYSNPGRYTATVSLEHLYIPTSSGYTALSNAMRNGTYVRLRRRELGASLEQAQCVCTSLSTAAPDQDAVVVSSEFALNGGWSASV